MHPAVFQCFESFVKQFFTGQSVLEVGALPNSDSLLSMECLKGVKKAGINLVEVGGYADFEVIKCNSNNMSVFVDESFDLVMSNATLEHDPYFWRSIAEMKRVCRKGGIIIMGVPGFARRGGFLSGLGFLPDSFKHSTPTFHLHYSPGIGDYYRFSEQCILEVFLEGLHQKTIRSILSPPRIIGLGIK